MALNAYTERHYVECCLRRVLFMPSVTIKCWMHYADCHYAVFTMLNVGTPFNTVFNWEWCTLFYIENDAEIFPAHYMLKVAEKGLRWLLWWINLQWLILVKLFLKNRNKNFAKNHCEIQVRTILECVWYSIKYGEWFCEYKSRISSFNRDVRNEKDYWWTNGKTNIPNIYLSLKLRTSKLECF